MNAAVLSEVLQRREPSPQADLPLGAAGVLRYVWESRFGPMLIEVREGRVFVNGQPVEPAPTLSPASSSGSAPGSAPGSTSD